MHIYEFNGHKPIIDPQAYIADTAVLSGEVTIGPHSSVWFGAILRGDIMPIIVGEMSNVQDNTVIHVTHDGKGVVVGNGVCLGHAVILHECTIEDYALVGMNATVLDNAVIGTESMVGAGSVVSPNTVIPPGVLALGSPARPKRDLTQKEKDSIKRTADRYRRVSETYRSGVPFLPD